MSATVAPSPSSGRIARVTPRSPVRVMLVDDSIVVRSILERILATDGRFEVVASCARADDALRFLERAQADVALLDLEMPGMHGVDAIPAFLRSAPSMRILILSANCASEGAMAVEALARGAHETLLKPGGGATFAGSFSTILTSRLLALSETVVAPAPVRDPPAGEVAHLQPFSAIGIGGSTGGIAALHAVLAELPRDLACPLFVTQHLPASFVSFFADQLSRATGRDVAIADDAMRVEPNRIYVANGESHLRVVHSTHGVRIILDRQPAPTGITPSVDPMLASLGHVYGASTLGVILSGMGRDGLIGAQSLRASGGQLIAQDSASSVVWGMPGAVVAAGLAQASLSPQDIGIAIARSVALKAYGAAA